MSDSIATQLAFAAKGMVLIAACIAGAAIVLAVVDNITDKDNGGP